jgi:hypothetical protein
VKCFRARHRRCAVVGIAVLTLVAVWPADGNAQVGGTPDVIIDWNETMLDTMVALQNQGIAFGPGDITRAMAMTQGAVFEAVNSINRTYFPYQSYIPGGAGASPVAATAQAAHDVLVSFLPMGSMEPGITAIQSALDIKLTATLASVTNGSAKTGGIALGQEAARRMIDLRKDDGAAAALNQPYVPDHSPNPEEFVPQTGQTAYAPGWGKVTPFVVPQADIENGVYRAPPPPALDSPAYAAAFNEVKELGSPTSTTRTEDQTKAGLFWAYDRTGKGTPPRLFNEIAQMVAQSQGNTLEENARLFALINLAMADAGIAAWDTKYLYEFWRPITAIQRADEDDNDGTIADPDWVPLGAPGDDPTTSADDFTPPHPSYTSGHSTFGAAFFETLSLFFGKDDIPFTITSEEKYCDPDPSIGCSPITRSFDSFSEAAEENGRSRIYLGIHWNFDDILPIAQLVAGTNDISGQPYGGQPVGEEIAEFVFANALQAVPAPPAATLVAAGLAGLGWLGRGAGNRRRR